MYLYENIYALKIIFCLPTVMTWVVVYVRKFMNHTSCCIHKRTVQNFGNVRSRCLHVSAWRKLCLSSVILKNEYCWCRFRRQKATTSWRRIVRHEEDGLAPSLISYHNFSECFAREPSDRLRAVCGTRLENDRQLDRRSLRTKIVCSLFKIRTLHQKSSKMSVHGSRRMFFEHNTHSAQLV